jgi:MFS family permease
LVTPPEPDDAPLQALASEEAVAISDAAASAEFPRVIRALRIPDYRLFWFGNFLSNIGTWMQNVAQSWLVLVLAERGLHPSIGAMGESPAFWLGLVGFASSAPMLAFGILGGVIADRVDRRKLLLGAQTAMMLSALALFLLAATHTINVTEVVLLAFVTGTAMSLNMPSYQALVPQLVPREDLTNAIALNSAQFNMSRVLGPTLGGFVMAGFGVPANFLLNALSFLAVIAALLRMKFPPKEAIEGDRGFFGHLRDGFAYVRGQRQMSLLILLVGIASMLAIPYLMFVPYFARTVLQVGEKGLGLLMAFSGLGAFLGAATIAYAGKIHWRGRFIVLSGMMFFVAIILFTFSRSFVLSGGLLALAGFSMIIMVATVNSTLQHLADDAMRGRVMSIYATAFLGFAPIGSLIAGSLAGTVGAAHAIAGMSGIALVSTLWVFLRRPELRRLD